MPPFEVEEITTRWSIHHNKWVLRIIVRNLLFLLLYSFLESCFGLPETTIWYDPHHVDRGTPKLHRQKLEKATRSFWREKLLFQRVYLLCQLLDNFMMLWRSFLQILSSMFFQHRKHEILVHTSVHFCTEVTVQITRNSDRTNSNP